MTATAQHAGDGVPELGRRDQLGRRIQGDPALDQPGFDVQDGQDLAAGGPERGGVHLVSVDRPAHIRPRPVDGRVDEALAGRVLVALDQVAVEVHDHDPLAGQVAGNAHGLGMARLEQDTVGARDACARMPHVVDEPDPEEDGAGRDNILAQRQLDRGGRGSKLCQGPSLTAPPTPPRAGRGRPGTRAT
jgi:hypothetical protein